MASSPNHASHEVTPGGEIEEVASQIEHLNSAVEDLVRHKADQDAVNEDQQDNIEDLRAELAALKATASSYKNKAAMLTEEIQRKNSCAASIEKENTALASRHAELQDQYTQAMELNARLKKKQAKLEESKRILGLGKKHTEKDAEGGDVREN